MTRPRRRAGLRWRLLVHDAPTVGGDGMNGVAHHVASSTSEAARRLCRLQAAQVTDDPLETRQVLPDTEFDELVVDDWLHVEQQDVNTWWMTVGGVTLWVTANRDGKPRRVSVTMPGGYDLPQPGCVYSLDGEPWEV